MRQLRDILAQRLKRTEEEQALFLPIGKQKIWDSRVGLAKTYVVKAGLLTQLKRGFVQIEPRGAQVIAENPAVVDDAYLMRFPEFKEFKMPGEPNGDEREVLELLQIPVHRRPKR